MATGEGPDKSRQPIPEVPATSSSAWNALLRSTLADAVEPKAEGWRSGLDALLVFLGLFSAIVTAFIIPSLLSLKQDEMARTNEILTNLTSIIITISGANIADLSIVPPSTFVPATSDVRLNLSIGALAIACRGFINLVSWSPHHKAVERLTDIRTRWKAAEKLLGPAIESLPQLLIIPVLLFILGLIDSLFSTALELSSPPASIIATSSVSLLLIATVAGVMSFAVVDGTLHPTTSPFQSRLAYILNDSLVHHLQPLLLRIRNTVFSVIRVSPPADQPVPFNPPQPLSAEAMQIYHEILQATRDDDILDEASAALFNIISQRTNSQAVSHRWFKRVPVDLLPQECDTLLHLLSPEASVRSHYTAAQVIVDVATSGRSRPLRYSQSDIGRLLPSLSQAARRANTGLPLAETWDSSFLRAMALVANSGTNVAGYPSAVVFLGAEHWSWKYLAPSELSELFTFVFEIVDDRLRAQRVDADPSAEEESIVDAVLNFSPFSFSTTPTTPIDARNVLASLLYLSPREEALLGTFVSWLLRLHPPTEVVAAAQRHIETIQRAEWLHLLGHLQYSMVPRLVTTLADRCLALAGFNVHAHLVQLCATCLLHTPSIRSRAPAGFVFFARPLLTSLLETLSHLDVAHLSQTPEGGHILRDVAEIRRSVEQDLLWKDGRDEVLRAFDQFFARVPSGYEYSPAGDSSKQTTKRTSIHRDSTSVQLDPKTKILSRASSPDGEKYAAAEAGRVNIPLLRPVAAESRGRERGLTRRVPELDTTRMDFARSHLLRMEKQEKKKPARTYAYPVISLPNEITSEIFIHFLPVYPLCPPMTRRLSPILLTHVCRKWRIIAHSTPTLWRALSLSFGSYDDEDTVDVLHSWLARSGACPLSIRLDGDSRWFNNSSHEVFEVLVTYRARWEYMELLWIPADIIPLLPGPLPLLRRFELSFEQMETLSPASLTAVPLLHSALLQLLAVDTVTLPWAQLTSLSLVWVRRSRYAPVLQQTPNLVHCVLVVEHSHNDDMLVDVLLPQLESLVLITDNCLADADYLDTLITPALREIHVADQCLGLNPLDSLATFISKSGCKLQSVRITGNRSVSKTSYLGAFPAIPNFSFSNKLTCWDEYLEGHTSDDSDEDTNL
ncbi:hypothetical protein C8R43DRAFT_948240 [Mycena crocata]|nr:hypothetical protein C8R43DRAFT_948240 [Mycena crocata]